MKRFLLILFFFAFVQAKSAIPLLDFKFEKRCLGDSTLFYDISCCNINVWSWDFGDPTSGAANFASTKTAKHKYNSTGTYTVTLRLGNGSLTDTIIKQVIICIPVKPILSFHDTTICEGNNLVLYSKNSFDKYYWNTSDTTRIISISTSGKYILCATNCDSTCLECDTAKVTIFNSPAALLGRYTSTCNRDSVELNARNIGFRYLWNTGDTVQKIWAKKEGWYFVKIYNLKCSIIDSTYLTFAKRLTINFKTDTGACEGDTVFLNPGWNYKEVWWNYTDTNHILKVTQTGIYPLRIIYQGCVIDTYAIVSFASPFSLKLQNDTVLCEGDSLTVTANLSSAKFLWSNGDTTKSTKIYKSDTLWLLANFGGCYQTDTVILQIINRLSPLQVASVFTCASAPATIAIPVPTGVNFKWWDGIGNKSRTFVDSGWHNFELSNSCFTIYDSVYTGFYPEVNSDTTIRFNICFFDDTAFALTSTPAASYLWKPGYQTSQSIKVSKYGWYSVALMDSVGCRRTDSFEIIKNCVADTIFIPNAFSPNKDGRNELFKPTYVRHTNYEFSVFDRWGELLYKTNNIYDGWDGTYKSDPAPEDVYVYIIEVAGYGVFRQLKGTFHLLR